METVETISNFQREIKVGIKLQGRFFTCPKLRGKGYRVNQKKTGFTVNYNQEGKQRKSTFQKIERIRAFLNEFKELGLPFRWEIKAIVASAEAKLLFPEPVKPPLVPQTIREFPTISSNELLENKEVGRFWMLYQEKPWLNLPKEIVEREYPRVANVLSRTKAPKKLVHDFVDRVFAEYALEGLWFAETRFGTDSILIGIETPETPMFINTALPEEKKIPVVQLK